MIEEIVIEGIHVLDHSARPDLIKETTIPKAKTSVIREVVGLSI